MKAIKKVVLVLAFLALMTVVVYLIQSTESIEEHCKDGEVVSAEKIAGNILYCTYENNTHSFEYYGMVPNFRDYLTIKGLA